MSQKLRSTLILFTSLFLLLLLPMAVFFVVSALPGDLDTSFSGDGQFTDDGNLGGTTALANAVHVNSNDEIFILGRANDAAPDNHITLWKLNEDGTLDTSFSSDGRISETGIAGENYDLGYGIVEDSNGDFIMVGAGKYSSFNSNTGIIMAKFDSDGDLVTSFDGDGYYDTVSEFGSPAGYMHVRSVNSFGDDIYVTGRYSGGVGVWKFDNNGNADSSFGNGGSNPDGIAFEDTYTAYGRDVEVDSEGRVIVAGEVQISGTWYPAVWRFEDDGTLDTSFDSDGFMYYDYGGTTTYQYARGLDIDSNDKLIITGWQITTTERNATTWRLNEDGSFDTGFDSDGRQEFGYDEGFDSAGYDIKIDEDGNYVVMIESDPIGAGGDRIHILRYLTDGSLDPDFGNNGVIATAEIGGSGSPGMGEAIVFDSENRIIIAGSTQNGGSAMMSSWRFKGGPIDPVDIDIRPGECTNVVDVDTTDIISVVVNGSGSFDVTDIDTSTIEFDGASPVQTFTQDMSDPADCDGVSDTYTDLVVRIRISDLSASTLAESNGATPDLTLTADLTTGGSISGDDEVEIANN